MKVGMAEACDWNGSKAEEMWGGQSSWIEIVENVFRELKMKRWIQK
jgi:hypothetical protein